MPKKTIAFDLDDVLAVNAQSFIDFSNLQWGTTLAVQDFQEDFRTMWGVSNDEVRRRMEEYSNLNIAADYPHFEDSVPVLTELSDRFNLIIVTSRRNSLMEQTAQWLRRYYGDIFQQVHHSGIFDQLNNGSYSMTKLSICQDVNAEYLVDDQLKHCYALAEAGIETVLFGSYSWNQADELPPLVTRAVNWQEVKEFFDGRS